MDPSFRNRNLWDNSFVPRQRGRGNSFENRTLDPWFGNQNPWDNTLVPRQRGRGNLSENRTMDPSFRNRNLWGNSFVPRQRGRGNLSANGTMDPRCRNRNPWDNSVPRQRGRGNSSENFVKSTAPSTKKPKKPISEVEIPVEFGDSFQPKNLKTIAKSKATVEKIRQRMNDREFVELIRQNARERLKITEEIMMAMLKLDAIQGVNAFVRESRRAVIRELVKLQETVDAIVMEKCRNENPEQERKVCEEKEFVTLDYKEDSFKPSKELDEPLPKCGDDVPKNSTSESNVSEERDFVSADENKDFPELAKDFSTAISIVDETEISEVSSELPHIDNNKDQIQLDSNESFQNDLRTAKRDDGSDTEVGIAKQLNNNDLIGESRSVMENLIEENHNLKKAIEELCRKNQMQDDIIVKITKRVEELERKMFECENEEDASEGEWITGGW